MVELCFSYAADLANMDLVTLKLRHYLLGQSMLPLVTQVARADGGGGGIRLIVSFQPLMVISPTASWIRWCMQVW